MATRATLLLPEIVHRHRFNQSRHQCHAVRMNPRADCLDDGTQFRSQFRVAARVDQRGCLDSFKDSSASFLHFARSKEVEQPLQTEDGNGNPYDVFHLDRMDFTIPILILVTSTALARKAKGRLQYCMLPKLEITDQESRYARNPARQLLGFPGLFLAIYEIVNRCFVLLQKLHAVTHLFLNRCRRQSFLGKFDDSIPHFPACKQIKADPGMAKSWLLGSSSTLSDQGTK